MGKFRTQGYKTFFMLNSTEHGIYHAHNVKMPTIVGILTFISTINTTPERFKERKVFLLFFHNFSFYEQLKFHAHLNLRIKQLKVNIFLCYPIMWFGKRIP